LSQLASSAFSQLGQYANSPGAQFTDNVLRFIIRYMLGQKLRCQKWIHRNYLSWS